MYNSIAELVLAALTGITVSLLPILRILKFDFIVTAVPSVSKDSVEGNRVWWRTPNRELLKNTLACFHIELIISIPRRQGLSRN